MAGPKYVDIVARLTPEAEQLFVRMVEAHLAAPTGRSREFYTWGLSRRDPRLRLIDGDAVPVDPSALRDLESYSLIRLVRVGRQSDRVYDVSGESLKFYRWLQTYRGEPIEAPAESARRLVEGDGFAAAHAGSAHHISEALALAWSDRTDDQTVSEIGTHLRSAVMDLVSDLVGDRLTDPEQPKKRVAEWLPDKVGEREAEALVNLVEWTVKLANRLAHVRDEIGKGRPLRGWDEVRRAAHLTSVVCFELSAVARGE